MLTLWCLLRVIFKSLDTHFFVQMLVRIAQICMLNPEDCPLNNAAVFQLTCLHFVVRFIGVVVYKY